MSVHIENKRPVLIIVTDWPDGTMAFKFGGALFASLGVAEGDRVLIQKSPERIFRVQTQKSETEFRAAFSTYDVASGGNIIFVEL